MANLKSAKKRLRQNERRRDINKRVSGRVRSARSAFRASLGESDKAAQAAAYATFCSALDKAVKSGIIVKNNATRHKARAANALRTGVAPEVAPKTVAKKKAAPVEETVAADAPAADEATEEASE